MTSRRTLVLGGAALVAALGTGAYALFGRGGASGPATAGDATAGGQPLRASPNATVDFAALMEPGPLGDMSVGSEDAPVVIIEYASLTCGHCATFHARTYPELKEKYIDNGQARLIMREFPLDPVATAAAMVARCVPEDRYFPFIDALFEQQRVWAYSNSPLEELAKIARQTSFSQEAFDECLQNQSVLDGVNSVKSRATSEFGVRSTPTFFINGELLRGAQPIDEFDRRIEALLTS